MRHATHHVASTLASLVVFSVIMLGIAGISYQLFSSDGWVLQWLKSLLEFHPMLIIVLGGACLLVKHWMESLNPGTRLADLMLYIAGMAGLYTLFEVIIGG